jgi:hypothetical protein
MGAGFGLGEGEDEGHVAGDLFFFEKGGSFDAFGIRGDFDQDSGIDVEGAGGEEDDAGSRVDLE